MKTLKGERMVTGEPKNILVADDSLFFRIKLSDVLIEAGHKVTAAKDGAETIERLKGGGTDLLILDLQMPVIDGFGVLKWMGENGRKGAFPVLAITGVFEPAEVIEDLKALGASGFMPKDLSPEEIVFRVNRLLFFDRPSDKRTLGERVPVTIPADFTYGNARKSGTIINLSETGAFLHTDVELLKGTPIRLRFALPGSVKVLDVGAIVRWFPYEIVSRIIFCGYGVLFTSMSTEDRRRLNEFISTEAARLLEAIDL